jgi:hypothetical protein
MIIGLLFYSSYKVLRNLYGLGFGLGWAGFSIPYTVFWAVMVAGQANYLS